VEGYRRTTKNLWGEGKETDLPGEKAFLKKVSRGRHQYSNRNRVFEKNRLQTDKVPHYVGEKEKKALGRKKRGKTAQKVQWEGGRRTRYRTGCSPEGSDMRPFVPGGGRTKEETEETYRRKQTKPETRETGGKLRKFSVKPNPPRFGVENSIKRVAMGRGGERTKKKGGETPQRRWKCG